MQIETSIVKTIRGLRDKLSAITTEYNSLFVVAVPDNGKPVVELTYTEAMVTQEILTQYLSEVGEAIAEQEATI